MESLRNIFKNSLFLYKRKKIKNEKYMILGGKVLDNFLNPRFLTNKNRWEGSNEGLTRRKSLNKKHILKQKTTIFLLKVLPRQSP